MKISDHIEHLQKLMEEKGDQELFLWVNEDDGFLYPVVMPLIVAADIDCNQYQIKPEYRTESGEILIVTNLDGYDFNRDQDDIQDLDLEILEEKGIENENV